MSQKCPTLEAMGVTSLQEIERYSLQTIDDVDILRIVYKRKKGSLLPNSKKYRFGRYGNTMVTDSGSSTVESVREVSPELTKAVVELDSIVNRSLARKEQIEVIFDELRRLEEDNKARAQHLRSLVSELIE
ncbi:MAG: DUF3461 family protein [Thiolinea sp.]